MSLTKLILAQTLLIGFALSCATTGGPADRPLRKNLPVASSIERAEKLSDVSYEMFFEIGKEDQFKGDVTIRFNSALAAKDLAIDLNQAKIDSIILNGQIVPNTAYNKFFITLPGKSVKKGANEVRIQYSRNYSKTGDGLYRFKDPKDNRYYVYTDFQPYDSNKLFPGFDQPDLKATYKVSVLAPKNWTVVTSVMESSTKAQGNKKLWSFPTSQKYSTYIFPLHAGPYKVWNSKAGNVPLRLMARQSLAKYVRPKDWFVVTQQGFDYFTKYFDYPYPFGKYDQIIVPDFNAGAMENVAAVTFSERYVKRSKPTRYDRERKANVILHELAHMWYGNLVTMKWWNDLWLNESFATYMATLALVEATEFKGAWETFYSRTKQWAYWEDQLVTTHPIEVDVPDTEQAFANFDGITYGKGASVIKQLNFLLGREPFRRGVADYFKKYAYKNTELKDFLGSLEKASGKDLSKWSDIWLRSAGLNSLQAEFSCKGGKVRYFELGQLSTSGEKRVREHRTRVALFYKEGKKIRLGKTKDVTYSSESNYIPGMIGEPCPDFVYPNFEDYDFAKVILDKKSLEFSRDHINYFEDPMLRQMIWQAVWDMVRDGKLSVVAFNDLVFKNIPKEKNVKIVRNVVSKLYGQYNTSPSVIGYLPSDTELEKAYMNDFYVRAEKMSWSQARKAKPGSDIQKFWFDSFVEFAWTPDARKRLVSLLKGKKYLKGFKLDQDRRWGILWRMGQLGEKQTEALRVVEAKKDATETGIANDLSVQAVQPDATSKRKFLNAILDEKNKMSLMRKRWVMYSLFPKGQEKFREDFASEFFDRLPKLAKTAESGLLNHVTQSLVPTNCAKTSIDRLEKFLKAHDDLPPVVMKKLKVAKQEDERCEMIRTVAKGHLEQQKSKGVIR